MAYLDRGPTNIQIIEPSRQRLRPGDLFAIKPADRGYLFGRVIDPDTRIGNFPGGVILTYIYALLFDTMEPPPREALDRDALLIPPFGINRLPWSRGYFHTVERRPLEDGEVLPTHVFHRSHPSLSIDTFLDVNGHEVEEPAHPVGDWGLHSFRTIDDDISRALGIPLAHASHPIGES